MEPSPRYIERLLLQSFNEKYDVLVAAYEGFRDLPNLEGLNENFVEYRSYLMPLNKTLNQIESQDENFLPYIAEKHNSKTIYEFRCFWRRMLLYELAYGQISDSLDVELKYLERCFESR